MSSTPKSVIVRDRQGFLYAIPAETLQTYCLPDSDYDSAATFYLASDDDVTGQCIMTNDSSYGDIHLDGMPWHDSPLNGLPTKPRRLIKTPNCY